MYENTHLIEVVYKLSWANVTVAVTPRMKYQMKEMPSTDKSSA